MMLALAVIDNIFDDDKLLMRFVKGYAERISGIDGVAAKYLLIHPCYPCGGFEQSFPFRVFPDQLQYLLDMVLDLLTVCRYTAVHIILDAAHAITSFLPSAGTTEPKADY
ncbi:hypothetical protein D3C71_1469710 [compost metagenome]